MSDVWDDDVVDDRAYDIGMMERNRLRRLTTVRTQGHHAGLENGSSRVATVEDLPIGSEQEKWFLAAMENAYGEGAAAAKKLHA